MGIQIGEVTSVRGVKVVFKVFSESGKETLFFEGKKYKGVSIREYLVVRRGFRDIACVVEGEYLDEATYELKGDKKSYIRRVEARPIGYFEGTKFIEGIKYLPMIKDPVLLIQEEKISKIFSGDESGSFQIGNSLKEGIPITLPWSKLFNTHIGIFGNTGSGKSNTLAKLYTTLFQEKLSSISEKSKFIWIDFNGEYTNQQLTPGEFKQVYNLSTKDSEGDRVPMPKSKLWDSETLSVLFKATNNTQKPFISRVVNGWKKFGQSPTSLTNLFQTTFKDVFTSASPKRECCEVLLSIVRRIESQALESKLAKIEWHGVQQKFMISPGTYFSGGGSEYNQEFKTQVEAIDLSEVSEFDELIIRINLQLIRDLLSSYVQFEHIQPLLKRIEASVTSLEKVIDITEESDSNFLNVISLRRCNSETKKIIPLLIAKNNYEDHKDKVGTPPNNTLHIVIDEAHNVLSQLSIREQESWKDYRLELFEEIIKEGRKFGVFLTLSSQRPADISPTIISQIHNFFIHRLVNDRDLQLLDNSISTLDSVSKSLIPNLSKGCCVITGSSFDLPLLIEVDRLESYQQPDSDDVNLSELWS